ncbi:hypothetical protein DIPPA_14253 [Diplonema papillatum]|nr:hypothetical protein DIPPA_02879 [Diplonema papillatum]KAJ9440548.1 hypothetical protein DIPPA_14253 [Diplonema papillatum]
MQVRAGPDAEVAQQLRLELAHANDRAAAAEKAGRAAASALRAELASLRRTRAASSTAGLQRGRRRRARRWVTRGTFSGRREPRVGSVVVVRGAVCGRAGAGVALVPKYLHKIDLYAVPAQQGAGCGTPPALRPLRAPAAAATAASRRTKTAPRSSRRTPTSPDSPASPRPVPPGSSRGGQPSSSSPPKSSARRRERCRRESVRKRIYSHAENSIPC